MHYFRVNLSKRKTSPHGTCKQRCDICEIGLEALAKSVSKRRNITCHHLHLLIVLVAQWIARWTSNPEAAGSNPVEDVLFYRFHAKHTKYD